MFQKAWRAKFNLRKKTAAKSRLITALSTIVALNHVKFNSSSYNFAILYQVLQISEHSSISTIFKKAGGENEKVLVGTFLPPGSGLTTPGFEDGHFFASPAVV